MMTVVYFRLMKSAITAYSVSKIKVARKAKSVFLRHCFGKNKITPHITHQIKARRCNFIMFYHFYW